ncbi:hypothetical protein F7C95_07865 [Opitutia bacterium ISCC 51]|nr:hypothetical protein F7C95_07865 [Opitutae bacterium ISCC 51]QXD30374.1 hypothetical protein GA003_07820 [Opitutae bacterium ISCC 52]
MSVKTLLPIIVLFQWVFTGWLIAEKVPDPLELHYIPESHTAPYYTVSYQRPDQPEPGQLLIPVQYTLWIPEGLDVVRGIIIHQHGCGEGANSKSVTAAHDLHWQELARRNDCALLGPSFRQRQEQDCRLWCDARNGSAEVLVHSLGKLATASGHPEVADAPWCVWGHSGGGYWASTLKLLYPERIVAIWYQSGTAYGREGGFTLQDLPAAAYHIPMIANPGIEEKTHERFHTAWDGSLEMTRDYRAKGIPIAFTPDPKSGHQNGDSRHLSIPFFEASLKLRLPDQPGDPLKTIDESQGWLVLLESDTMPIPFDDYSGDKKQANWLPNQWIAEAWQDFVQTGTVRDTTPPPAPTDLRVNKINGRLNLQAQIDFESDIQAFEILRDGKVIGRIPEILNNPYGSPLLQGISYGDTPERLPSFEFVDSQALFNKEYQYEVIAINSVGLRSK